MYGRGSSAPPAPPSGAEASGGPNQRYNYLVARLRNRQITMEEATELFALMQGMISRAGEVARAAAYRASATVAAPPPPPAGMLAERPRGPAVSGSADDLLLVGILAMGAGAGLLAALSQRMGDTSSSAPSESGRSRPSARAR